MSFRILRLAIARVVTLAGLCMALQADQIVLRNGDRITGSIAKKDAGNLVVKSDLMGTLTIPWDKVESVKTEAPVSVATKEGQILRGTMALANGAVEVVSPTARVSVPVADVTAIRNADEQKTFERMEHPGLTELWAGSATIGWAGSLGNARTLTFTTGANAQRTTRNDKITLSFNSIKATAFSSGRNSSTAQAVRGGLDYDHNIGSRLFINTFNDYEYDKFQSLDLRFVLGGGAGFHAVKTNRSLLDVLAGGDYNHSSFSTPATTMSAEAFFGDDYTRKIGKMATLTQTARMFNDLTNTGTYRVSFDTGTSVKVTKWLNWNVSISDRYLSRPATGRKPNDILYTTGLGFSFSK
jgi:hypothetical protein